MPAWVEDAQQLTELRDLSSSRARSCFAQRKSKNSCPTSTCLLTPLSRRRDLGRPSFSNSSAFHCRKMSIAAFHSRQSSIARQQAADPAQRNHQRPGEQRQLGDAVEYRFLDMPDQGVPGRSRRSPTTHRFVGVERFTANIAEHPRYPHITRPFDILHDCLAAQRSEIFLIMRAAQQVTRIFATIHKQAGIFVDNIDEYLIHYINFSYLRRNEVHERFVRIWHAGQVGAWLALRRLHGINPHVRIFVSIRKEAYQHAAQNEPQFRT